MEIDIFILEKKI